MGYDFIGDSGAAASAAREIDVLSVDCDLSEGGSTE